MFIELSCGLVNLNNINIVPKKIPGDTYRRISFRGDAAFSTGPGVTQEDIDKIKALLLPGGNKQRHCNRSRNVVLSEFDCEDTAKFVEGLHCG